jgi:hypothetical protein
MRAARLLLPLLVLALAVPVPACVTAKDASGSSPPAPIVTKLDQALGVYIEYQASDHGDAARVHALQGALTLLNVNMAAVDATVPTGSALLVAQRIVQERPELGPYEQLIAKLYTLAVYGTPAPATPPAPGAGSGVTPAPLPLSLAPDGRAPVVDVALAAGVVGCTSAGLVTLAALGVGRVLCAAGSSWPGA